MALLRETSGDIGGIWTIISYTIWKELTRYNAIERRASAEAEVSQVCHRAYARARRPRIKVEPVVHSSSPLLYKQATRAQKYDSSIAGEFCVYVWLSRIVYFDRRLVIKSSGFKQSIGLYLYVCT